MNKTVRVLAACLVFAVGSSAASLTVTSPNGNENWPQGSTHLITWSAVGVSGKVKLVLFKADVKFGDIASDVSASQQGYSWVVGTCDAGTAPDGADYKVKVRKLDNTMGDMSNGTFTIGPPGPGPGPAFALTSPNGNESWPLGSTRLITWNPGVTTGYVRLDLYKGGSAPANLMGCITSMTPAATGKYSWHVGDRDGMTPAALGNDYFVVIHAYTPDLKDPGNGPFTIAPPDPRLSVKAARAAVSISSFSITNPRRGDRWYKGTGYTITWTTGGLDESPVRLDLVKIDGSTLVHSIAENIPNNGQHFWAVPMSLPDIETLYRMRIRTMDNAHSDTPAAFYIAKAKPPSGPPAIKVTVPGGPSQVGTGSSYAIRWTSTCGTSVNGPTDDAFDIELMNAAGSTRVRWLLERGQGTYDGGNPDGSHAWHWDWVIPWNETSGTYRIRVTGLSGNCAGLGEPFQLVYQQEHNEYVVIPSYQNCFYILDWCCQGSLHPTDLAVRGLEGVPGLARVGFFYYKTDDKVYGFSLRLNIVLRSLLRMDNEYWYKDKGHLQEAKMTIERQWRTELTTAVNPNLGGVVLLSQSVACENGNPNATGRSAPPAMPGAATPINTSQGNVWVVDLTQPYLLLTQSGKPDLGLMLYPVHESSPCEGDSYMCGNAECYKVTLRFRFAKDITH